MISIVQAQEFSAAFAKPSKYEIERQQIDINEPVEVGAFTIMAEDGLDVINPLADEEVGSGEDNVTDQMPKDKDVSDQERKHRPYGGVILIGWAF